MAGTTRGWSRVIVPHARVARARWRRGPTRPFSYARLGHTSCHGPEIAVRWHIRSDDGCPNSPDSFTAPFVQHHGAPPDGAQAFVVQVSSPNDVAELGAAVNEIKVSESREAGSPNFGDIFPDICDVPATRSERSGRRRRGQFVRCRPDAGACRSPWSPAPWLVEELPHLAAANGSRPPWLSDYSVTVEGTQSSLRRISSRSSLGPNWSLVKTGGMFRFSRGGLMS